MATNEHLAVEANKRTIQYAMEGNKEAWLALYADNATVCDPVGKSRWIRPARDTGARRPSRASGTGSLAHPIRPSNLPIRVDKRWTSGDYRCCVAQVARNDMGNGIVTECDMLTTYDVDEHSKITAMSASWSYDDMMAQIQQQDIAKQS